MLPYTSFQRAEILTSARPSVLIRRASPEISFGAPTPYLCSNDANRKGLKQSKMTKSETSKRPAVQPNA